jgi:nicotinamidase-related amidase
MLNMGNKSLALNPHDSKRGLGLVIVDLQNDFLHPKGAYARGGATNESATALPMRVLEIAKSIKSRGGLVCASLFTLWPKASGEPMISEHLMQLRPFLKRGDFAAGSWGQELVEPLRTCVDVCVQKVAYSAFFNTQLDWVLKKAGITDLVVCGIVTNGGVDSTVRDAHLRDYDITVLSDACAAFTPELHHTALADMKNVARVITCAQALEELQR